MTDSHVNQGSESVATDPLPPLIDSIVPCENLTRRIRSAGIPAASSTFGDEVSYSRWFESLRRALFRDSVRHAVIVAEPGVGTLTVLAGFARQLAADPRETWRHKEILWTDWEHVPPEESPQWVTAFFTALRSVCHAIVCMDGLLGAIPDPWWSAARPHFMAGLDRTQARIVLVASPAEYEDYLAGHPKLRDRFERVDLHEPSLDVAKRIVRHAAMGLQIRSGVAVERSAVEQAVTLSNTFIPHDRLPAKAIRILQRVCDEKRFDRDEGRVSEPHATGDDVVRQIAQVTGIAESTIRGTGSVIDYASSLEGFIKGQPHAIQEIATEMRLIQAGLTDAGRPASVMMFAGQTGTGKTEMAKALARLYSTTGRLKTYTLGNFSEPHSVSGIIGVPAGYVGHDKGGRLINELLADPYGVFLFDEADKAHPDVLQPLLNLFDEGWIVDQRGVKARADRAIFILTTNVGQRQIGDMFREGKSITEITGKVKEMLSQIRHMKSNRPVFSPEFLARLRRIIVFGSLNKHAMHEIAGRLIDDLRHDWLHRRQKQLVVAESVVHAIGREAHTINEQARGREGGRIVRKLIADSVETAILNAISQNTDGYQACQIVSVEHEGDDAAAVRDACRVRFMASVDEAEPPAIEVAFAEST